MTNKALIIIIVLAVALVSSIGVSIWAVFFREADDNALAPDYPPQETESNQVSIPEDSGGVIETPAGGGAVNITYAESIIVDLSDKKASLYYANPLRSNQNVAIAVVVGEDVIIKSGLINPGNMVTSLPLADGVENKLTIGSYNAEIVVYCYHPETGEKAMIDTRGAVTVTVTE